MPARQQPLLAEILRDERGHVRCTVRLSAEVGGTFASSQSLIYDLSETGLQLKSDIEFEIGETLNVELPLAGSTQARIVWNDKNVYGAEFVEPVSKATVSAALLSSHPFTKAEGEETTIEELVIGTNPTLTQIAAWAYTFEQTMGAEGYKLLGFRQTDDGVIRAWCSKENS